MKYKTLLMVVGLMLVLVSYSSAQVPQLINYQGKLTKSTGAPLDTTIQMIFSIYSDSNGAVLKWTETQGAVVVEKGIFNVLLGNVNPIPDTVFNGNIRYLGVRVGGDPEITPRKPMVSVPYAYRSATGAGDNDWTINGDIIYHLNGDVGIGTTSPNEQLEITGNLRLPVSTASVGVIKSGANRFIHNFGTNNFFAGVNAGNFTLSGIGGNTGVGSNALQALTSGGENTAVGPNALYSNTTGDANTAMGPYALYFNTTGGANTAVGHYALWNNTTGYENTAVGKDALSYNSTGYQNTAMGQGALNRNTTGTSNTANGYYALYSNTTGLGNTANGYYALYSNTTGEYNTATGRSALYYNSTGNWNTANGQGALYLDTTGSYNTADGFFALYHNTGSYNTANGYYALYSNAIGSYNTALGYNADVSSDNLTNSTAVGANAVVAASNSLVLGGTGANAVKVGIGTTSPQGALDVSSTTGALIVPRMTTAQRDALTAVNGMIIYNTTTNQFNFYENGAWVTK